MKKFLPSKKFVYLIIVFIVLGIIFWSIFNFSTQKKLFFFGNPTNKGGLINEYATVNDSLQQDTDGDGVMDWEETLWGTDKNNKTTFDGISDLTYIEAKKKELNIDPTKDEKNLTETEKFAREFFATYVAMKTAGKDPTTISNFSTALGEKITYPSLIDGYYEKDIKTTQNDDAKTKIDYYNSLQTTFETYKAKGMGEELSIVANNLTGTSKNLSKLTTISNAYQDFAKKIMTMTVPQSLVQYHLKIANSANNTGISIVSMTQISNDPIVGLSGLSQYQKYSDEFVTAAQDLEAKLKE